MRLQFLGACVAGMLSCTMNTTGLCAGSEVNWERAAYWDERYPTCWTGGAAIRDGLEYAGYSILDADQLKIWMEARISDGADSVVVFCQDIAPDTVVETMSWNCTLRQYLNAGGKIVWYADIPLYYQGHRDGTRTVWDVDGAIQVLGFHAASAPWDGNGEVTFTDDGRAWGLTTGWQSTRPRIGGGRVLARDPSGYAAAWVQHYVPGDYCRGFVRFFDQAGVPDLQDVRRVAEYPNVPAPVDLDNEAERDDDIVAAFFYPWYGNPNTSGRWVHWDDIGIQPLATWTSCYLPNYPQSDWNPAVQLYDSTDTQVLRWQDRAMARANIDIAISSWWGVGTYEDQALAQAIRTCKSVQWCIYYEEEAYGDPSAYKIYQDIKSVLSRFGPTRNYAQVDGRWLVFVYGAQGNETADRWREAKAMLAADGYPLYLNADTGDASPANAPDPWDAVHQYNPVVYYGLTDTLPHVDDSAWVSPGFWRVGDSPALPRSLTAFQTACDAVVSHRQQCRFFLIETWNEWHEGTQIESGQEIDPYPTAYQPGGYDYGEDFINATAAAVKRALGWSSAGNRPAVPTLLLANDLVWEPGVLAEGAFECRIPAGDVRVGKRVFVPGSGTLTLSICARAECAGRLLQEEWPEALVYVDHEVAGRMKVASTSSQVLETTIVVRKGAHTLEVDMDASNTGVWSLIVTSIDVQLTAQDGDETEPFAEGFEGAQFSVFPWRHEGPDSWVVTSGQHNSGAYSAKAGAIGDGESTSLSVTLACAKGEICFYRKVSCEENWDFLEFRIDGVQKGRWTGELDWEQVPFSVEEGTHTFTWTYRKDGSSSSGEDTAWIDDIVFPLQEG